MDGRKRRVRPRVRSLPDLVPLVRQGRYRIGSHAVRHATCEGFTEHDIVHTVLFGREMMRYVEDERLLVLGYLPVSADVRIPLHVVLEYRTHRWVDVVTAYIPDDPHRVVSRARLAEWLRYDRVDRPERGARQVAGGDASGSP
ncbi:MAG: DUF4258 domain-containing protein [Trueperaceae bacterium]